MKKLTLLFISLVCINVPLYAGQMHQGHGGNARGNGAGGAGDCIKAHINDFTPAHLATVKPGSEFSFTVVNIASTEQVVVTVKRQPVEVVGEFIDPFFLFKGKLPDNLANTYARIDVVVNAKATECENEDGWLLKIAD